MVPAEKKENVMRKQKKYTTDIPKAKYSFGIKIYYSDGGHKYWNDFRLSEKELYSHEIEKEGKKL